MEKSKKWGSKMLPRFAERWRSWKSKWQWSTPHFASFDWHHGTYL